MTDDERKRDKEDIENVKEILSAVSSEVPALIKSLLNSVFSEEAGRSMGKAAAAYYKELKDGGLPEPVAVKLTEEYMRTFTSLGDMLRRAGSGKWFEKSEHMDEEIERKILEKVDKAKREREEE